MVHVRGFHEAGGLQGLRVVRSKEEPGKLTTKLARLDHQRGLLERQLAVWTEKQQVTRQRLTVVQKQMDDVGRLVRALGVSRRARKRTPVATAGEQQHGGGAAPPGRAMDLEY